MFPVLQQRRTQRLQVTPVNSIDLISSSAACQQKLTVDLPSLSPPCAEYRTQSGAYTVLHMYTILYCITNAITTLHPS